MGAAMEKQLLDTITDNAAQIATELCAFSDAAGILSSDHPRLIDAHPLQWVALYHGRVAASGVSMASVMNQLEQDGISPAKTIIRFIDREEKTLIL